ncbi:uncharacterized protein BDR25DRAFT_356400 [Lindgomyces ingoldianus]|uniref:Uncharacterized protein n=1 Tax=Lindgomyces ingoldianus TaxID=673940 RepID=A0ACB6QSW4_9PLEO|nr:uncharacterized protein BDR25DRAFT_356400 [Lindgomyces ingoldianus]KAF2469658.1 hypothetical protein BDR25DRAFT_356400 [Lindgomyces ingoldianus]
MLDPSTQCAKSSRNEGELPAGSEGSSDEIRVLRRNVSPLSGALFAPLCTRRLSAVLRTSPSSVVHCPPSSGIGVATHVALRLLMLSVLLNDRQVQLNVHGWFISALIKYIIRVRSCGGELQSVYRAHRRCRLLAFLVISASLNMQVNQPCLFAIKLLLCLAWYKEQTTLPRCGTALLDHMNHPARPTCYGLLHNSMCDIADWLAAHCLDILPHLIKDAVDSLQEWQPQPTCFQQSTVSPDQHTACWIPQQKVANIYLRVENSILSTFSMVLVRSLVSSFCTLCILWVVLSRTVNQIAALRLRVFPRINFFSEFLLSTQNRVCKSRDNSQIESSSSGRSSGYSSNEGHQLPTERVLAVRVPAVWSPPRPIKRLPKMSICICSGFLDVVAFYVARDYQLFCPRTPTTPQISTDKLVKAVGEGTKKKKRRRRIPATHPQYEPELILIPTNLGNSNQTYRATGSKDAFNVSRVHWSCASVRSCHSNGNGHHRITGMFNVRASVAGVDLSSLSPSKRTAI